MKTPSLCIAIILKILLLGLFGRVGVATADEYDQFVIAKNAFDAGEYQESVRRFEELLKNGLQNPTLVTEALKLLGVSYLFTENRKAAEEQFTKLLTKAPDYTIDPLLYPIEVVDFFTEVKQKNQKRLDALAKAKAIEEAARKAKEEAARKAEFERMKRNIYLERNVTSGSLLVAVLPFGAGQFQNRQKAKGWAFLSSEALLCVSSTVFFFLHSSLRSRADKPFEDSNKKDIYIMREKAYRIANHASLITLGVTAIAGIADSLYFFKKERVEWKKVNEKDVPENLRPHPAGTSISISLFMDRDYFVFGLAGSF